MQDDRSTRPRQDQTLLGAGDPSPVQVINPEGRSPFLLLGDHAGNAIPRRLGTLGLSREDRVRHIAWDIGVAPLGAALAGRLDAVFLHQAYSRLVIDCNRAPDREDAIARTSDSTRIEGNAGLSPAERGWRVDEIHQPYQRAIATEIARRTEDGQPTILVSLHSFTPRMNGFDRPWQIGILHDGGNDRFARRLLDRLAMAPGLIVGDNQPYVMDETDHTVPTHAFAAGLPYAEIEIAQGGLLDARDVARWADLLAAMCADASCDG